MHLETVLPPARLAAEADVRIVYWSIARCAQPPGQTRQGVRGTFLRSSLLILVLLLILLAEVLLCSVYATVDLFVMLMVGVALADSRYVVDCLVGLLTRVLLGVGLPASSPAR